ncbi:MAG: rhodanese-like domain-containing protein [Gemmatimonadota bacterium]
MQSVNARQLKQKLDQNEDLLLLNTLDPPMFEQEHIPGSYNVPNSDPNLVVDVERLAERKDRQVIVYCANPQCHASPEAGQKLEREGFQNVAHFPGGMEEWKQAGYDVAHGAPAPTM